MSPCLDRKSIEVLPGQGFVAVVEAELVGYGQGGSGVVAGRMALPDRGDDFLSGAGSGAGASPAGPVLTDIGGQTLAQSGRHRFPMTPPPTRVVPRRQWRIDPSPPLIMFQPHRAGHWVLYRTQVEDMLGRTFYME
jgi:hypothetical protein